MYFTLPAFPSFDREPPIDWGSEDISGLWPVISYTTLEDGLTPSYLELSPYDASIPGYYLKFTTDPDNWPTEPRHDFINITMAIGSYFSVSRVVEINFYEFDTTIADDKCFHVPIT